MDRDISIETDVHRARLLTLMAGVPDFFDRLDQARPGWMREGACSAPDVDRRAFFPKRSETSAAALAVCRTCPVQLPCVSYALDHHTLGSGVELTGVWGSGPERHYQRPCNACRLTRAPRSPVTHARESPREGEPSRQPLLVRLNSVHRARERVGDDFRSLGRSHPTAGPIGGPGLPIHFEEAIDQLANPERSTSVPSACDGASSLDRRRILLEIRVSVAVEMLQQPGDELQVQLHPMASTKLLTCHHDRSCRGQHSPE